MHGLGTKLKVYRLFLWGVALVDIHLETQVSVRTITRWAKDEAWSDERRRLWSDTKMKALVNESDSLTELCIEGLAIPPHVDSLVNDLRKEDSHDEEKS
jgi:hypothetical protein